jgi:hypothetical protein
MSEIPERFNSVLLASLTQPLPPKFEATLHSAMQTNVECSNRSGARFAGTFASLTLKNCVDVHIERAHIGQLVLESSSATLKFSVVDHPKMALIVKNSRLSVTAATLRGATAIENDASELDMAGVTVLAGRRTADVRGGGRIYFSVSEIAGPDYVGDAHFIWTEASLPAAAPKNAVQK